MTHPWVCHKPTSAAHTGAALRRSVETPPPVPTIPNLSRRHRDALQELRLKGDLVIAYADKNLGLIADDATSYLAHSVDSLHANQCCLLAGPHTASNVVLETLYSYTRVIRSVGGSKLYVTWRSIAPCKSLRNKWGREAQPARPARPDFPCMLHADRNTWLLTEFPC
eukprot:COSAG01_NODE_21461_length_900_cov_1.024938_2_plen_167_part_00